MNMKGCCTYTAISPLLAIFMGWDQGLLEMCVGEKRKLKIPSKMGYGEHCSPPKIPDVRDETRDTDIYAIPRVLAPILEKVYY
ncbi:peptidyl-prolyl cis-trans isomerase FKBP15-1-like protein [Tanacetum coccineum]